MVSGIDRSGCLWVLGQQLLTPGTSVHSYTNYWGSNSLHSFLMGSQRPSSLLDMSIWLEWGFSSVQNCIPKHGGHSSKQGIRQLKEWNEKKQGPWVPWGLNTTWSSRGSVGGWLSQPEGWAGVAMVRVCESPLQDGCKKSWSGGPNITRMSPPPGCYSIQFNVKPAFYMGGSGRSGDMNEFK